MKKRIFGWLALLCPLLSLYSQPSAIRPLAVGDPVPDLLFSNLVHYPAPTARLSDFTGKVVILDLMATNCKSCLIHLSHMDTLLKQYPTQLQILPVTYEPLPKVRSFLQTNSLGRTLPFPFVTSDTILRQYFPHQFTSHLAWIYKGRVVAITSADYVRAKNIGLLLAGKPLRLPVKTDVGEYDPAVPLWIPNPKTLLPSNQANLHFYSSVTPALAGFAYGEYTYTDTLQGVLRTTYINYSIPQLYLAAAGRTARFPASRIRLEVEDSSRFFYNGKGYKSDWMAHSIYCYQSATAAGIATARWQSRMQNDLDFYLNLHGRMEKRQVTCWVLRPDTIPATAAFETTGNRIAISGIADQLNRTPGAPPAFSEVPDGAIHYVPRPVNLADYDALTVLLRRYGIRVVQESRKLELLVISDADEPH